MTPIGGREGESGVTPIGGNRRGLQLSSPKQRGRRGDRWTSRAAALALSTVLAPCFAAGWTAPAAAAPMSRSNEVATRRFITANFGFLTESAARRPLMLTRTKAEKHKLLAQCGSSAAGSPENELSYELSYEAAGALWSVSYGADAAPIAQLARSVSRIHWSEHAIDRRAEAYATSLVRLARLPSPQLCADITSWKATGFQTVPKRTKQFDERVEAIEVQPVPESMLARYATAAERATLKRCESLERELLDFETAAGGAVWYSLLEGLGLSP